MITKYFSVVFALLLTTSMIAGSQSAFAGSETCEEACMMTEDDASFICSQDDIAATLACSLQRTTDETNCFNTLGSDLAACNILDIGCIDAANAQFGICLTTAANDETSCLSAVAATSIACQEAAVAGGLACLEQCAPAVGGEIIGIESSALLVAGTHTTTAWLIPALVSAVGIALVIARRQ